MSRFALAFVAALAAPALAEAGYAEIDPRTWFGAFAPGGTPPALLDRLHADIRAAITEHKRVEEGCLVSLSTRC